MEIKRCYDTIVGASVGENQLVTIPSSSFTQTKDGITITDNRDGTYTVTGTSTRANNFDFGAIPLVKGHKYYIKALDAKTPAYTYWFGLGGLRIDEGNGEIWNDDLDYNQLHARFDFASDVTINNITITPQIIDLTQKLGSTIADYLYTLETATAGAGIAKLRSWGFLKGYQAYNAGSIESVEVTGKKCVGFNAWDEEVESGDINENTGENVALNSYTRSKNYIKIVESASYYFKKPASVTTYLFFYDSDKNFIIRTDPFAASGEGGTFAIPNGSHYMRFSTYRATYNHDICINLSSDRNGEYEPYHSQTYALGSDTLRGIFKLDANNNLYADGDVKTSDGTITRKYGIRAYQSGDESLPDAITDGTTTVYKLTTPTTEHGDPFPSPQIVYPDGTEEYVTGTGVPVGHETRYEL